ncbi:FAD-binding domain-containing protein [Whalleya microplaca]|nr:FAD-binding domain-containing protein [Whalleya microplaca]
MSRQTHLLFLTPLLLLATASILAQPIDNTTITPIAEKVAVDSASSGVNYFSYEATQLTIEALANLPRHVANDTEIFNFGDSINASERNRSPMNCKSMPSDPLWPTTSIWRLLDLAIGGALIKGVPSASVCYVDWPQYDEAKCAEITAKWSDPAWQASEPTGIDWPVFEGISCLPPAVSRSNATCTLGGLPSYIVNVSSVAQIQLAVNFARNLNLRLNVKNKGHDFNAKSTGAGSLSIWTHFLQDIRYLGDSYPSASGYKGPAFKIGAGVSTEQLYKAANEADVQVTGGIARTVGIGGGYVAGGGHSPLISKYGMAADQVISMEVVLPDGRFVSVDENNFPDLFFALRGGGGSTWGIVTSLVIRAYPRTLITKLTYSFGTDVDIDTFWAGVAALFAQFTYWPKAGMYSYWSINCTTTTACKFSMAPQLAPDLDQSQVYAMSASLFANLSALGIHMDGVEYVEYDTLLEAFEDTWPVNSSTGGFWTFHTASRLFPVSNWDDAGKLAAQTAAIRSSVETGGTLLGYNIQPAINPAVNQTNAVNPAWRNTCLFLMHAATWSQDATPADIAAVNKELVDILQPWREASPGSGAYLNEADINEPDWQQAFYGSHYQYLYDLKRKYDPWGLMYAPTAVGAEDWFVTHQIEYYPTQNGRLCPVGVKVGG